MIRVEWAKRVACELLAAELPRRWAHTLGVAERARGLASILEGDADLIEVAAWLHDVGYASDLAVTGFHPLDGARYLRDLAGVDGLLCRLVAHHSGAMFEAAERGLDRQLLGEFSLPPADLSAALTFCDMTTSQDGAPVAVEDRIADVLARYGEEHVVARAIARFEPYLIEVCNSVGRRLDRSHGR